MKKLKIVAVILLVLMIPLSALASQAVYANDEERLDAVKRWPNNLVNTLEEKYSTSMYIEKLDYGLMEDFEDVAFWVISAGGTYSISMIMENETYVFHNATDTDEIFIIAELVEWFRGYQLLAKELDMDFWIAWLSEEFTNGETVIIDASNYKDFQMKLGL